MSVLKKYTDFREFVKFNKSFLDENPFLYFNLRRTIRRVLQGKVPLYDCFNVIDGTNRVCSLLVENECLLYASGVTDNMISTVAEGLGFHKFKRYQFFGTKNIIDALFSRYNVQYSEQKHRKYYQCTKVAYPFTYADGEITMGEIGRLPELTHLGAKFIDEFYDDEKPTTDIETTIRNGIESHNLFQWLLDGRVVGIAQVMYEEFDFPLLGHVFTHPDVRGRGIASSLAHKITKGLLEQGNEKCMLMTDAYNPASNKAFHRVGYKLVCEYVVRYKQR